MIQQRPLTSSSLFVWQEIKRTGECIKSMHIQLDNTTRENKNKYVMSFCQWLVAVGLVLEIRVGFLIVG